MRRGIQTPSLSVRLPDRLNPSMHQDSASKFRDSDMPTATSQVTATSELLRLVCGFCSSIQNRHNALVSKRWSNEALSVLWYELDSLAPLLALLAPLKLVDNKNLYVRRNNI